MKTIKIFAVVAVIFFSLSMTKNLWVQAAIGAALSKAAHVPVHIGSTNVSLTKTSIDLKGIRLENPSGFPERLMLDAPQVAIAFDLPEFFKQKIHFRQVTLNIKELIVIKSRDGSINVNALKSKESERKEVRQEQKGSPKLQIDRFELTIGRVVYKDYSQGAEPVIQVFDINIQNRTFTNIHNPTEIVSLIMFETLTKTTISRLANLDTSLFKDGASGVLSNGLGLVEGGADKLESTAKGLISNLFK